MMTFIQIDLHRFTYIINWNISYYLFQFKYVCINMQKLYYYFLFFTLVSGQTAALSSATQHTMTPEFGGKWGAVSQYQASSAYPITSGIQREAKRKQLTNLNNFSFPRHILCHIATIDQTNQNLKGLQFQCIRNVSTCKETRANKTFTENNTPVKGRLMTAEYFSRVVWYSRICDTFFEERTALYLTLMCYLLPNCQRGAVYICLSDGSEFRYYRVFFIVMWLWKIIL